jgi:Xaa-Pro aminopeptidase
LYFSLVRKTAANELLSVTPGITAQEYADRRSKLAASLPKNGIAILSSSDTKYRSGAVFYEFHQEPNFLYLTGFNEPEAVAVIEKIGTGSDYKFHLFLRPKDSRAEQWDGARSGEQAALDVFNADEVFLSLDSVVDNADLCIVRKHQQFTFVTPTTYCSCQ